MKPIEPGCMCLVIDGQSQNVGLTVVVKERYTGPLHHEWVVKKLDDSQFSGKGIFSAEVSTTEAVAMSRQLLRIDDYDASADATEQEREVEHG